MRARELKPGHSVLHSGEWRTVEDVETCDGVTRVATMIGGHIAYCAGMWVSVRTGK